MMLSYAFMRIDAIDAAGQIPATGGSTMNLIKRKRILVLAAVLAGAVSFTARAAEPAYSALWGESGELWTAEGRLPDFSFAGYHRGEALLPAPPVTHNVRDFGAAGDGVQDDSDAFLRAIAEVAAGVILIPEGRYLITKPLTIDKPNLVLRGGGPGKSVLFFPTPLNDIAPNWGATTGGRPTSNYSWSGGFIAIRGIYQSERLAEIGAPAQRGGNTVAVNDAAPFQVGQEIEIRVNDDPENSLAIHLYSDDPRVSVEKLNGHTRASLVARITALDGNTITVDRPLRFDLRAGWKPGIYRFAPTVTESGIEEIGFEFPNTPYGGHFTELGYNAFAIGGASHCWVRNVHIHNADSGGFVSGCFNTIDGVLFTSERAPEPDQPALGNRQAQGHHGIILGDDNICTRFDFQSKFIHDLGVSGSAGNVYANGKGRNLSFDHHCHAPYENLYTNIDVGAGAEVWRSGGGRDLGAHCGARGTFWNIRADLPIAPPNENFGPWSVNLVGVGMDIPEATVLTERWYEHNGPGDVAPVNLHEAQLEKRLRGTASSAGPTRPGGTE